MSFETFKSIYAPSKDIVVRYGQSTSFKFNCTADEIKEKSHRLFFTGETTLFYFWKGEYDCVPEYCNIEDALDNKRAEIAPYCLDLTNKDGVNYPKVVFKKTEFPPVLAYLKLHSYNDDWKAGIHAKTENLTFVSPDAKIRVTYEVRYEKENIPHHATTFDPDEIYTFDIPVGTYDWTEYGMDLKLPKDKMANIVCYIEAQGYVGTLLLERPYLISSNGFNVLPDFQPPYLAHDKGSWLGHNISRKEWPEFEITLNGNTFFVGEMFERCHKYSECTCTIPDGILAEGENTLEIKLISDYPNPMPYAFHEVGCFVSENKPLNIIACPENVPANGKAAIMIKTKYDNMQVELVTDSPSIAAPVQTFEKAGIDVFVIETKSPANNVKLMLKSGDCTAECELARIVERAEDNVTTGTGDIIYVNQANFDDFAEYVSWYFSNNIGNLLTIRPTYRWSGTRVLNPQVWEFVVKIVNKLGFKYVHMTDGREFPGGCANPPLWMLEGEGFMGRQSHEFDGAFGYWPHPELEGIYPAIADYWRKLNNDFPETANTRQMGRNYVVSETTGKLHMYVVPYDVPEDMEKAAELLVKNLRESKCDHTRHTGPSVYFKYFIQAGYDWSGAELMYGPLEMISAFMRGAAYCYDKASIGGHLAIQWSTTPHDVPERYRRYKASLYSSYLQGLHDINTEEGLWHLEEYYSAFHRNSEACLGHTAQQQDFYRYVSTHTRSGKFHTDFGFIYGRYDGFRSFAKDTVFARLDSKTADPELSWELLNIFYPLEVANGDIYLHPCPTDREVGMLTGTPRGNVDVIPMEASAQKLMAYKALAFLGYNKALPEDMDKLCEYVSKGGTLLIGLPHMSITSMRGDVVSYNHEYISHSFVVNFADGYDFVCDTFNGEPVTINRNIKLDCADIILKTDNGNPLVARYKPGNGIVYFVNAKEYPAASGVEPAYRMLIESISNNINEQEHGFIECDDTVQFAIYDQEDGSRHIYVLAVDWYHNPNTLRNASFVFEGKKYPVSLRFSEPVKIVVNGNTAAWTECGSADVLCVGERIKTQGIGCATFNIVRNGELVSKSVDFSDSAIQYI